ncbi:MAG: hypothetical protein AUG02_06050 [Chloroflexi bacterium 13_1_20CM_2_70_9]|nr:MAG: hypothetical protein AUG02_06050 [Chloroflexi bacterium 13_1_20CM_2_70_9]
MVVYLTLTMASTVQPDLASQRCVEETGGSGVAHGESEEMVRRWRDGPFRAPLTRSILPRVEVVSVMVGHAG